MNTSSYEKNIGNDKRPRHGFLDDELFLRKKMTPDEFKEYMLIDNSDIKIEDVDFSASRITV